MAKRLTELCTAVVTICHEHGMNRFERRVETPLKRASLAKTQRTPRMNENEIGKIVVDAAIAVHRELGPRLLESVTSSKH